MTIRVTAQGIAGAAALLLMAIAAVAMVERTQAQVPATEEQALAVEQQLLCPICTNERLDVCSLAICRDMKQIIRDRLEAGSTPDDIILFFETRYGPKVRAHLEPRGFNLWLYGWIVGSTGAVAALGGWFLYRLRQGAQPSAVVAPGDPTPDTPDDAWLDAQIAEDDDRNH
ncbi:MAG: cytochrome c-type biogenesis protein CcmH [Dehalococcoidia bacterium]